MKNRNLFILTVSLGAIALLLTLFEQWSSKRSGEWNLPEDRDLLERSVLEQTAAIRILQNGTPEVTLSRNAEGNWVVSEYHAFPLNRSKLDKLLRELQDASLDRFVTANTEKTERLNLGRREIQFLSEPESVIHSITFGKPGKNGGLFVKRESDEKVYFTDFSGTFDVDPAQWVSKDLLSGTLDDLQKVSVEWGGGESVEIQRNAESDAFELTNAESGESLDLPRVQRNLRTLLNARFTEVHQASDLDDFEAAMESAVRVTLDWGDAGKVEFALGRETTIVESKNEAGEVTESEEHGPVYATLHSEGDVSLLPQDKQEWVLQLSDYTFTSMPASRSDWIRVQEEALEEPVNQ